MKFEPLYTATGTAEIETLGKVQDGERIKVEFRGNAGPDSRIHGKAHGSNWILVGALGPGATTAVQELVTSDGLRVVLELHGYALSQNGGGMEIRTSGIIRSSAAEFAHLNGRIALVVQKVTSGNAVTVEAYSF